MTHSRSIPTRRSLAVWVTAALATPSVGASEIHSHPDARGEHRPSIHESGNGTPVVDITTPGADGVSHNVYRQLDVDKKGVVFNNGRTTSATALAGQIGANPALASGTADLILNEVRSATPSQLAGYLEIGGDPADLVVANPAGITCDGCGFINAERAMLTTGRPLFDGDRWTGLDVRGGRIRIEGEGMDASRTAEADLLARAVEINAGLWADRLEITTGTGRFDRSGTLTESLAANTPSPEWGIDTARLGGMYANKIRLVANEHGVGVRNAGTIAAGEAGLAVTVDGKLVNHGTATTAGNARLQADRITNTGEIHAQADLELDVAGTLDNRAGRITGQADVTANAAALDNRDGAILTGEALTLTLATGLENEAGLVFGQDELQLATSTMSGDGQWLSDGDIGITIGSDHEQQGEVVAGRDLSLQVDGELTNHGRLAATGAADVGAEAIANLDNAEMVAGALTITADDHLHNRGLIDGGEVDLAATTIDNTPGARIYGDLLSVTAHALRNLGDDASAATLGARDRLELGVDHTENRNGALILSAGDMQLAGRDEATADHLLNENASIEAFGDLSITADRIDNLNAGVVTTQVDEPPVQESWIQLRGSQRTFDAADCSNLYHENVWCQGYPHEISDFTWFQATAVTSHTEVVESRPATLQAGGNMSLEGGTLRNVDSQIIAGDRLQADLDHLDNHATQGQDITRREGTARFTTVESCGFAGSDHCREWHGTSPYRPAPEYGTPYDLPTVTFTGQADPAPSAPTIPGIAEADPSTSPALPSASLFRLTADNPNASLIETDPRFTAYRQWYGSEAMLEALARDPAHTQKRLGDGFYEQALVRQQVIEQTGQRRLDGFADDDAQFRALIDAGIAFGRDLDLAPGVRLTAEQLARLTTDIVWLESETVTTGGEPTRVLVPRLHLTDGATRQAGTSGRIAATDLDLSVAGTAVNRGTLAASEQLTLSANRIENLGGSFDAARAHLSADTDIHQRGGQLHADHALSLTADRDILIEAEPQHGEIQAGSSHFSRDQIVDRGRLSVAGAGKLDVIAGRDLKLQAADVTHDGSGATTLFARHDLEMTTATEGESERLVWDAGNRLVQGKTHERGTRIDTRGNLELIAGRDLAARAAIIDSLAGKIELSAGDDLQLDAGRSSRHWEEAHKITDSGFMSGSVTSTLDASQSDRANGTQVGGQQVTLTAGQDISIHGSQAISDHGTRAQAGRNLTLSAVREENSRQHFQETTRSGLFSNGGLSITYGSHRLASSNDVVRQTRVPAQLASIEGDVSIDAGDIYHQKGSALLAPMGDVDIQAGRVEIVESRQTGSTSQMHEMEQSGLTLALTSPVIDAAKSIQRLAQAADDTDSDRMKRLAAASAGLAAVDAYSHIKTGGATEDANLADKAGGVSINISVGASESHYQAKSHSDAARGSYITAGGDVRVKAAGQDERSDILVRGSDVRAEGNASLSADDEIALFAAESRREERSENDSQSASVGIGIDLGGNGVGFSITASAARGEGESEASELTHRLSHVSAGETASLQSGGDTALVGAVVTGQRVQADVGGDLRIESVQDRTEYRAEQHNESVGVSIPLGGFSVAASYSKEDSEAQGSYRSVTEQSAIRAGEGGFDLTVAGNTDLVGGAISSDADPTDNRLVTGTLTSRDLTNSASASAEASGLSLSSDMVTQGRYGAAKGLIANTSLDADRSGESQGRTRSAIGEGLLIITDQQRHESRTDMTVGDAIASLSRQTNETHTAATFQDAKAMHTSVEADSKLKTLAYEQTRSAIGDWVYASDDAEKKAALQQACDDGASSCEPEIVTDFSDHDFAHDEDGTVYLFNHGIFNSEEEALNNAVEQHGSKALETGIYTVINPETPNVLSESVYASLDKIREFTGLTWLFGASNSSHANVDIREAIQKHNERAAQNGGQLLYIEEIDHSRGSMTASNATRLQEVKGETSTPVRSVLFNGAAANAQRMADRIDTVTRGLGEVHQNTHQSDLIGIIFGANASSGGKPATLGDAHGSYFKDLPPKFLTDGSENPMRRQADRVWGPGKTGQPILVNPSSNRDH
ncbi:hemagglutinin repeat-containing protein [Guyparkeria sp. SB14A]|uniref:hemagglutinin repeat-containing protein n=1 Tax=Guyparkeria sp. SB14A TaxID=2571147 RepID=UPI00145F1CBD|nr:hemagglutinin repeat-containing protein [Guyparkeria sp. SB14A]